MLMLPHPLPPKQGRLEGGNDLAEFGLFSLKQSCRASRSRWAAVTPDGPDWGWVGAMSRCSDPGHRLPVYSCGAVVQRKGQWHQQRLQGLTRRSMYLEGGLLQDKEGKKKVLMERHGCMLFIASFSHYPTW